MSHCLAVTEVEYDYHGAAGNLITRSEAAYIPGESVIYMRELWRALTFTTRGENMKLKITVSQSKRPAIPNSVPIGNVETCQENFPYNCTDGHTRSSII